MLQCIGLIWLTLQYGLKPWSTWHIFTILCQKQDLVSSLFTFLEEKQFLGNVSTTCIFEDVQPLFSIQSYKMERRSFSGNQDYVAMSSLDFEASMCHLFHISPQFHVIFDGLFSSVISQLKSDESPKEWNDLSIISKYQKNLDDEDPTRLDSKWLTMDIFTV